MELYNPTFEKFDLQYDSVVYSFKPKSSVEVPEWPKSVAEGILLRTHKYGVYAKLPTMSEADLQRAEKDGLKRFLEGTLSGRIEHFNYYKDSMDKAGKTVETDYRFLRAKKAKEEIAVLISYQEDQLGDESYLPKINMKSEKKLEKEKAN